MRAAAEAAFTLPFPLDLGLTLGPLARGAGDPTIRFGDREAWRAARTPDGPGTLWLGLDADILRARAWGEGARWLLDRVGSLIGFDDEPQRFAPGHPLLQHLKSRFPGLRIGRTGLVFESLLPTILEQKVPGIEAWSAYSGLVRALGEPAPGPAGLSLQPSPRRLMATPYWAVHRFGIDRHRFAVIQGVASIASRLERTADMRPEKARQLLMTLPGIGPWSAAEVSFTAMGDRDAVSIGDYHLPHQVAWALAGEPRATDARMLELLEPYRGHRARVLRLLAVGGIQAPRFGPRVRLRRIAAI